MSTLNGIIVFTCFVSSIHCIFQFNHYLYFNLYFVYHCRWKFIHLYVVSRFVPKLERRYSAMRRITWIRASYFTWNVSQLINLLFENLDFKKDCIEKLILQWINSFSAIIFLWNFMRLKWLNSSTLINVSIWQVRINYYIEKVYIVKLVSCTDTHIRADHESKCRFRCIWWPLLLSVGDPVDRRIALKRQLCTFDHDSVSC